MKYAIKQDKFEGPLDLLLSLIQERELSINEISLAQVTDEFVKYIREIGAKGESDQELLAEFLVVAAQLLLLKSRSLLPQFALSPEESESIQELERRLADYQRLKAASVKLGALAAGGAKSFSREPYASDEAVFAPPKRLALPALAAAFRSVVLLIPKAKKLAEEKIRKVISLEEKIKHLQQLLMQKVERAFSEIVAGTKERVEIIVSFLALLELAKQKLISVEQKGGLFSDIHIRKIG